MKFLKVFYFYRSNKNSVKKLFSLVCLFLLPFLLFSQSSYEFQDSIRPVRLTGHPIISYTPETSWIFGAAAVIILRTKKLENIHQNPSTINPFFFFSLRKQYQFVSTGDFYFGKNFLNVRMEAGRLPFDYYGLGNFTDSETEVFAIKRSGLRIGAMRHITEHILTGAGFIWYYNKISDFVEDGELIKDRPMGFDPGFLLGLGPSLGFDSRDNIVYPHRGTYVKSNINFLLPGLKGNYHYTDFSIDARKYFSTRNKKNTLALQSSFTFQTNDRVPFYELNRVGGESRLRGILSQRYLDTKRGLAQIEYRRKLPFYLGFVLFGGAGKVFNEFNEMNFEDLKYSYGFGFRWMIIPQELTNFRIDFGYGSNGERGIYVGINEVF